MLDWIFEGIITWVASVVSEMFDAVSGLFLEALGTDMTAMEEYFPFVAKAFSIMQYTAWSLLFLITVWQLFKVFGGPVSEAENPWTLLARSCLFAVLIGYAKPIFQMTLNIARAPYLSMMEISMSGEDFTFAGVGQVLQNGMTTIVAMISIVGTLLLVILEIALGWNYFKLLLETVERYIVVGVLCYTSPLAYCMGGSKATGQVFKSWCRMVGSQLLLLVMNVWFLRGFGSSMGQYIANGGALSSGKGSLFLWLFCALAFLKTAQKFDSYLASMGLNVAQTGSSLGMEMMVAARVIGGMGSGVRSAGNLFGGASQGAGGVHRTAGTMFAETPSGTNGAAQNFVSGFVSRFKGNSFVRDAVVDGGTRMSAGGSIGFVGRAIGAMAARNGASLIGESISSVALRLPNASGSISGDIADRSLANYMPQMRGYQLSGTQISGGKITTKAMGADGKEAGVSMFSTAQFEKPEVPHSIVTASDGSEWYQMASGNGAGSFYDVPGFQGSPDEKEMVAAAFPESGDDTILRTVGEGVLEATTANGSSLWYNSAYFEEPEAPHSIMQSSNGVAWYAVNQSGIIPEFANENMDESQQQALFHDFMPGFEKRAAFVNDMNRTDGNFEVRHENGSGTMFYDAVKYAAPRGDYRVYEDAGGHQWYAVHGESAVEHKPVYENGSPVYGKNGVKTVAVESVRYKNTPARFGEMRSRRLEIKTPKKKQ